MVTENFVEFVSSRSASLVVKEGGGVIKGVKVLGMESVNGRSYPRKTLESALELYAEARVNVNHPERSPTQPRRYQDRLGMIRDPELREDGIYGDLYYNPRHAIAQQLEWDAEHAPENLGLSHNVSAEISHKGGKAVVEAIRRVLSVDLVADPATTRGLFEHKTKELEMGFENLTTEELREKAPKIVEAIEKAAIAGKDDSSEIEKLTATIAEHASTIETLTAEKQTATEERDTLTAEKTAKALHDAVEGVLVESKLSEVILTESVRKQAHSYADTDAAKAYVESIVEAVQNVGGKPRSTEQRAAEGSQVEVKDGKSLVEAITT